MNLMDQAILFNSDLNQNIQINSESNNQRTVQLGGKDIENNNQANFIENQVDYLN